MVSVGGEGATRVDASTAGVAGVPVSVVVVGGIGGGSLGGGKGGFVSRGGGRGIVSRGGAGGGESRGGAAGGFVGGAVVCGGVEDGGDCPRGFVSIEAFAKASIAGVTVPVVVVGGVEGGTDTTFG